MFHGIVGELVESCLYISIVGGSVAQLETDRNKGVEESVSRIVGELSQHRYPSPVCGRSRVITASEN